MKTLAILAALCGLLMIPTTASATTLSAGSIDPFYPPNNPQYDLDTHWTLTAGSTSYHYAVSYYLQVFDPGFQAWADTDSRPYPATPYSYNDGNIGGINGILLPANSVRTWYGDFSTLLINTAPYFLGPCTTTMHDTLGSNNVWRTKARLFNADTGAYGPWVYSNQKTRLVLCGY